MEFLNLNIKNFIFIISFFLIIIAYFIVLFFKNKKYVFNLNQKLNNSEEHNKILKNINDELHCFRHDYNNVILLLPFSLNCNL